MVASAVVATWHRVSKRDGRNLRDDETEKERNRISGREGRRNGISVLGESEKEREYISNEVVVFRNRRREEMRDNVRGCGRKSGVI